MLRRLDLKKPWRSLDHGFWPEDLPFGCKTVVYGHNGSGKSTLSELLLTLAEGDGATEVVWEDENKQQIRISPGDAACAPSIAVFTRRWVEANLSAFLDGRTASAIVTLGKEAIDAKGEETQLAAEIYQLRNDAKEAAEEHKTVADRISGLIYEVQDCIVSQLKEFNYEKYTKNRFSFPKVKSLLHNYKGEFPDRDAHAEALKRLGEGAPSPLPNVLPPPVDLADRLDGLLELLTETPTRVAIQALEGNSSAQAWVEEGLALHEKLDRCLFCDGEVGRSRREQLARHFDESWLDIRHRAQDLLTDVTNEKEKLLAWNNGLPSFAEIASTLQPEYQSAIQSAKTEVDERVAVLQAVERVLTVKIADPSATPRAPEWAVLRSGPSTMELVRIVSEHNDQANQHARLKAEREQTVLDHLVGSQSDILCRLEEQLQELEAKKENAEQVATQAEQRLNEVRQARFTTKEMADILTRDLARVYGKGHLTVAVTPDGKSYACRRGDQPGTDLSEGERTTLSLLYFLRKLEDTQAPGGHPSQRIIVIDDPSSSLDREAVFATHQWLFDTLKHFGQYVILTHDFDLLRLFIKSHKNAWKNSMKQIKSGDAKEICFPKVAFLEIYATSAGGERHSKVGKLPQVLLNNTSEYVYLFSMVMTGIIKSEDHERLFLLPNAARRLLEVFASYKAPHRPNFLQQLEVLVQSQEGEPYRDVYDFCNRYSHGEGSESVDVLDARTVNGQIKRCMQFLRSVDAEHFERMCEATSIDPKALS
ncbi:AAA family ATPase [Schaalia cardiffensis]